MSLTEGDIDARVLLDDLIAECTPVLLDAYGHTTSHRKGAGSEDVRLALSAVIGFTGDNARGTLLIGLNQGLIDQTNPTGGAARDWVSELANMLLGRMKNQLLRYGVEVYVTTPLVLRGEHIAPVSSGSDLAPHRFDAEHGTLLVWLDAKVDDGLRVSASHEAPPTEGDAFLFD